MNRIVWRCALACIAIAASGFATAQPNAFDAIDEVVTREIVAGKAPGAVVLVGNRDSVLYRGAFGQRALKPVREAMTVDTIFDLASLTKVIATTMIRPARRIRWRYAARLRCGPEESVPAQNAETYATSGHCRVRAVASRMIMLLSTLVSRVTFRLGGRASHVRGVVMQSKGMTPS